VVATGILTTDVAFTVTYGSGTPVVVTVQKDSTTDNKSRGDDHWKLVDASNAATFSTVQEMTARLTQVLGIADLLQYNSTTQTVTLRSVVVPRSGLAADVLAVAAGVALISAAAQVSIPLPFTPVPITGQTFAVVLVGASLGALRGTASLSLYLLLGILGAPIYAHHDHGWSVITGASGGYIVGFVLAAAVTGYLAERRWDRHFSSSISVMLTGNVIIYLVGLPWLAAVLHTNLEKTLEFGLYPFVAGDVFKLYLAAMVLPVAWRLVEHTSNR
jgi:biotin transport system substrate-specific component